MKQHVITVTSGHGQTKCDPARAEVDPGDTVRWKCETGMLALDFGTDQPFTSAQVWTAAAGALTPVAVVKPGIPAGTVFRPRISIDNEVVAKSLGDIILM